VLQVRRLNAALALVNRRRAKQPSVGEEQTKAQAKISKSIHESNLQGCVEIASRYSLASDFPARTTSRRQHFCNEGDECGAQRALHAPRASV
jgi:hypothetical protein